MVIVSGLSKSYGRQVLFDNVSFTLNAGERLGLVGRNGHGKTTLFRLLQKEEHPDNGMISLPKNYKVGHLSQHLHFTEPTILAECCLSLPWLEGSWQETYKAEAMLHGLGFSDADFQRAPATLSGGFQIRLNLAKLLLSEPNLLLLDEPTNYLDILSIRWLIRFLRSWNGELMLITHDRQFMDDVCTHTAGIHRCKMRKIEGPTGKLYQLLADEEELYEKTRIGEEKKRKEAERFITRFRAQATKARAVQSRIKQLDKLETKEKLVDIETLEFAFRSAPFPGKWLLHARNVSFGFTPEEPLISDLSFSIGKRDRIAIIGPNGKGKTTLLNLLAGEYAPAGGSIEPNMNTLTGYFGQTNIDRLSSTNTVEQEIGSVDGQKHRTIVRNICGAMMFEGDAALKKVSFLSGGERSRVLLGKLLMAPANLLLLDEPTNHLDMYSIDALLDTIDEFEGGVVIVSHSELILKRLASRLIVFDREEVSLFEGGYEEFLERVGWSSETEEELAQPAATKSKKDQRRERAEVQRILAPLKKRVTDLEQRIVREEERAKEANEKLIAASADGDAQAIGECSKLLHDSAKKITALFEKLDEATKSYEKKEQDLA